MNSLKDTALESNPYLRINFDGGDLSSDAGLLLIKEFAEKIGLVKLVYRLFKTNDDALFRIHIDPENLLQVIYQTMAAYFEDDCTDELTVDPVFTAILGKDALASQPTLSRFYNRMDETTLKQFAEIEQSMRDIVYAIKPPGHMLFDLDSTLLNTYGHQEGEAYQVRRFYCGRGKMENFIKEGKDGFDFSAVSSQSKIVNANRLQMHGLAYNLFNWFRRLVLAASMRKQRIDTVKG